MHSIGSFVAFVVPKSGSTNAILSGLSFRNCRHRGGHTHCHRSWWCLFFLLLVCLHARSGCKSCRTCHISLAVLKIVNNVFHRNRRIEYLRKRRNDERLRWGLNGRNVTITKKACSRPEREVKFMFTMHLDQQQQMLGHCVKTPQEPLHLLPRK